MVEQPFFNEPGFEAQMHTPHGKKQSAEYNRDIRLYTACHAILDMLDRPPPAFREVVFNHFRTKSGAVRRLLQEQWSPLASQGARNGGNVVKRILVHLDRLDGGETGRGGGDGSGSGILGTGDGGGIMMQQGAQQGHPSPPPPIKQQGAQQGHQSIGGGGDGWQHPDGLDPRSAALAAAERRQGTKAPAAAAGTADDAIVID
jgi:hypothetical protein